MKSRKTITDGLIQDLKARENLGIKRYGKPIYAGEQYQYSWLLMMLEELLDSIIYLLAFLELFYPDELAKWREQQSDIDKTDV